MKDGVIFNTAGNMWTPNNVANNQYNNNNIWISSNN